MTREELENLQIEKPNAAVYAKVRQRWDALAKPLDSLGEFEPIFAKIGAITGNPEVPIGKKAVIVMCADNGIVEEGVSQSGPEVTAKVAEAMGAGKSSVCRLARKVGADVIPVDVGISSKDSIPGVQAKKIRRGTRNFLREPAMTEEETLAAIEVGIETVKSLKKSGYQILATGEMGIGNTTTSSAMAAAMSGYPIDQLTGRGAGLSDEGLLRKREVIRRGINKHGIAKGDAFQILSSVGGFDIAALCGVYIGGAAAHLPIVMDGVISAVAALTAERLVPGVKEYIISSHQSREPASEQMLRELGVRPVLAADLALGEGTGALLMLGLLDMVYAIYESKTTFAELAMEPYARF